jgi:hypothetical protein
MLPLRHALLALAVAAVAACGSSASTTGSTTTEGATGSTSATTGTGGMGGGSTSTTATSGTGGAPACTGAMDCPDPKKPACDLSTGLCVGCLPASDMCPAGQYCGSDESCATGCKTSADCDPGTVCDPSGHECVACVADGDCPLGEVCSAAVNVCVPGCSATQGCAGTEVCCGASSCHDVSTDLKHCGDCATACPTPANAKPTCASGMCGITCLPAFADCNLDPADGCEWNVLQDGPCGCTPGATQSCYDGAPGTLNVGQCKAGVQTCKSDGTGWGACLGEVLPIPELCNGLDDDCDGAPEAAGCTACNAGTGMCNGSVSTYCPDGLGNIVENCDPLEGLSCNTATGRCVGVCSQASLGSSYIGCDYFPTVTTNGVLSTFSFAVAVSNTTASSATVTVTKGAATTTTVTVAPNSVQIIKLPWVPALKGGDLNIAGGGIVPPFPASIYVAQGAYRLRSTQPVTVYQFSPLEYTLGGNCAVSPQNCSYTNDASILLPTTVWTGQYMVASRHHTAGLSGFYTVTARDNGTVVNVTAPPGGVSIKAGIAGIPTTGTGSVTLNAGDVIEVVTNGGASASDPNDVSGTLVVASKPVQVIGGHQCIDIPDNAGYCDHLEESMFPVETLSTSYIVNSPLIAAGTTKPATVRFVATKANTTLTYDPPQGGAPALIAQAGQWVEIAGTTASFQVTASNPILVAQYMEGQTIGNAMLGDPSMSLAVATAQFRTSYLFHAPTNYTTNFVDVTAPTGTVVTLDGASVVGFSPIGGTGYSVAHTVLSNAGTGNHTIAAPVAFGISVYGYGQYTSYWYPGGSDLTKLHN